MFNLLISLFTKTSNTKKSTLPPYPKVETVKKGMDEVIAEVVLFDREGFRKMQFVKNAPAVAMYAQIVAASNNTSKASGIYKLELHQYVKNNWVNTEAIFFNTPPSNLRDIYNYYWEHTVIGSRKLAQ